MNPTLAFFAGFNLALLLAAVYTYFLTKRHLNDLEKVKEAGRLRGYAEGYQRKAFSALAPTD